MKISLANWIYKLPIFTSNSNSADKQSKTRQAAASAALAAIIAAAAVFRLTGLNWDQGHHLNPDERFLTMVVNDIQLPESLGQYFHPQNSPLNPRNHGYDFFVYGHLPINLNKLGAVWFDYDQYDLISLRGRLLSALADLTVIVIIYQLARQWGQKLKLPASFKLWAPLVYTLLVLPIQYAHFFTVDSFLNLFGLLSFYGALNYRWRGKFKWLLLSGLSFSCALASKISGLYLLPLLAWLILNQDNRIVDAAAKLLRSSQAPALRKRLVNACFELFSWLIIVYLGLRLADPYLFASASWLNPSISPEFINDLQELQSLAGKNAGYPPSLQWINTQPLLFAGKNLIMFGAGLGACIFILLGLILILVRLKHQIQILLANKQLPDLTLTITLLWALIFFAYQSSQFVKSIRYFLVIYPYLAVAAAYGLSWAAAKLSRFSWQLPAVVVILLTLTVWPLMFFNIYLQPHSRVKASVWMYRNLPSSSLILTEHWDDGLPLRIPGHSRRFSTQELPVFYPDDERKWDQMKQLLNQADYYVLSSNRGWGSITQLPNKYPVMSLFYQRLLQGQTPYQQIAEFTSYPSLEYLGIPLTLKDQWADEAFTVYDHPKVLIFKNSLKHNETAK